MRPNFDIEVRGNCFAPIEGYMIVKSGPTSFRHHGFYVVDEPYKNMELPRRHEGYVQPAEEPVVARIPSEVLAWRETRRYGVDEPRAAYA